jgi:protein-S-isoprenylcysteine O-methyltransferase Ste14
MIVIILGLILMAQTIAIFIQIGKETLAPWSPPRRLITGGIYTYVRNPMILGVILVLLGEALAIESWRVLAWMASVFVINTIYFVLSEEPGLEKCSGEEYWEYKRNVPRWIPRLKPWER